MHKRNPESRKKKPSQKQKRNGTEPDTRYQKQNPIESATGPALYYTVYMYIYKSRYPIPETRATRNGLKSNTEICMTQPSTHSMPKYPIYIDSGYGLGDRHRLPHRCQGNMRRLVTTVSFQLICRCEGVGQPGWPHPQSPIPVSFHQSQQSKCENIKAIFGLQHKHEELLTVFLNMLKQS